MIRIEWFPPRYNIAPTQPILVVRGEHGQRQPALVRWGLVPSWAKDIASLPLFFNARAETAAEKPAFRGAFRHRRCLVPASGFYEWRRDPDGRKQPFYIRPRHGKVVAFAGLWDEWTDAHGNMLDSATILTTDANPDISFLHDRMPVLIDRDNYDRWLGLGEAAFDPVADLLRPAPEGSFEAVPVDARVNNARNDDAGLQIPLVAQSPSTSPPNRKKTSPATAGAPDSQLKLL